MTDTGSGPDRAALPRLVGPTAARADGLALTLDEPVLLQHVPAGARLRFRGWAWLRDAAARIRVLADGETLAQASCEHARRGVVHRVGDAAATHCGFTFTPPPLPAGTRMIQVQVWAEGASDQPRATLDLALQPQAGRVFFIHIPKTAGSTVNAYMARQLGADACIAHLEGCPAWNDASLDPAAFLGRNFLSGHVRLRAIRRRVASDALTIATVLREPVAQLVSHIAWVRKLAEPSQIVRLHQHEPVIRDIARRLREVDLASPDALARWARELDGHARNLFDNCQVRYLAARAPIDWVNADDLASAREGLAELALVGRNARLKPFLDRLVLATGGRTRFWQRPRRHNVTRSRFGMDPADPAVRAALEPLVRHDLQLVRDSRLRHEPPGGP